MSDPLSLVDSIAERCKSFTDKALNDVEKLSTANDYIKGCILHNTPLKIRVIPGSTQECKDIYLNESCVLSVLNYYTFPVTAILDSIKLSQQGKLDDALDVRPLMFSGPAPTMVIWSGSDDSTVEKLGYPTLSDDDAEQAFRYWVRYIFGITFSKDWMLE